MSLCFQDIYLKKQCSHHIVTIMYVVEAQFPLLSVSQALLIGPYNGGVIGSHRPQEPPLIMSSAAFTNFVWDSAQMSQADKLSSVPVLNVMLCCPPYPTPNISTTDVTGRSSRTARPVFTEGKLTTLSQDKKPCLPFL